MIQHQQLKATLGFLIELMLTILLYLRSQVSVNKPDILM